MIVLTAQRSGQTQAATRQVLDAAADVAREALAKGREVFILGLGKLVLTQRGERKARNPRTGEPAIVPPRTVVLFRASESVTRAANAPA